jgi:hypothetical protein
MTIRVDKQCNGLVEGQVNMWKPWKEITAVMDERMSVIPKRRVRLAVLQHK